MNSLTLQTLLSFLVVFSVACAGCGARTVGSEVPAQSVPKDRAETSFVADLSRKVISIESHVVPEKTTAWDVKAIKTTGAEDLRSVHFLDQAHGWVSGDTALYSTTDGGQTWDKLKIELPPGARVAHVFFVSPSTGWVVLQKSGADFLHYEDFQSWVMQTKDAGQTWQLQHEDKNSGVTRILFTNDQEGWLTGVRYLGLQPFRMAHLLLHTLDRGQHWIDASAELNLVAAKVWRQHAGDSTGVVRHDIDMVSDFITDIQSEGPFNATVLTAEGRIYTTADGGQDWKVVMDDGPDYLNFSRHNRFGSKKGGQLWVALGADSSRSAFGRLKVAQDNIWTQYTLFDAYFWDALFVSDSQVLACGFVPSDRNRPSDLRNGVLFYSADGGHDWGIVYRSTKVKMITALNAVDPNNIWAVGDQGLILRLSRAQP